jgi:oxaloacetate decarboxylase alpha subunit
VGNGDEICAVLSIEGSPYTVTVNNGGELTGIVPLSGIGAEGAAVITGGEKVKAPLAENIFRAMVGEGQQVAKGNTLLVLEAMKIETHFSMPFAGTVSSVDVKEGYFVVAVGNMLLTVA